MTKKEFLKSVGLGLSIKAIKFIYQDIEVEVKKPYDVLEHGIIFSGDFYTWTNITNIEFVQRN